MLDFVINYNSLYPDYPFSAIHLDVEPYGKAINELKASLGITTQDVYEYYQTFITNVNTVINKRLELYFDIPAWFDGADGYFNNGTYGSGYLYSWVMDRCDTAAVMAYRDTSSGIIDFASTEFNYAASKGKRIMIAVETAEDAEYPYVTFFGRTQAYMNQELSAVSQYNSSIYGNWGISVHHLLTWMEMEP